MRWQEEYQSKLCSPETAIRRFVHSGDCIYGGAATITGQVSRHVPRVNGFVHDYPVSRFAAFVVGS